MLLPRLLSTSTGSRFLISALDNSVAGQLTVKKIQMSWYDGITFFDVNYLNNDHKIKAHLPKVIIDKGLLELLAVFSNWGLITLDSPVILLNQTQHSEKVPSSNPSSISSSSKKITSVPKHTTNRNDTAPIWNDLAAQLAIHNGRILLAGGGRLVPTTIVHHLKMNGNLSKGTIKYDLIISDEKNNQQAIMNGFVNLPTRSDGFTDALVSKNSLDIKEFPLDKILAFLPPDISPPDGEGDLNGNLTLTTTGIKQFDYSGSFILDNTQLHGGFLKEDQPELGKVSLNISGERRAALGLSITAFDLYSELTSFHLEGNIEEHGYHLTSKGTLDLPTLLYLFPATLKVKSGSLIKSGILDFYLDLENRQNDITIGAEVNIDRFSGLLDERPFIWSPVQITINGDQKGMEKINVNSLDIDSSFIQAHGQGDLTSFTLTGSADLEKAFTEIGNIFDCPWSGAGKLDFDLNSKANKKDDLLLSSAVAINNFSLSYDNETILPSHSFSFKARSDSFLSLLGLKNNSADLQLHISTWPGTLFLKTENIRKNEDLFSMRYKVSSKISLDNISNLLLFSDNLFDDTNVKGTFHFVSSGFIENNIIVARELNGHIENFVWHQPGTTVRDDAVELSLLAPERKSSSPFAIRPLEIYDNDKEFIQGAAGLSGYDISTGGLFVHELAFSSTAGKIKVTNFSLTNWHEPFSNYSISLNSQWNLVGIAGLLHSMGKLPPGTDFDGNANLTFDSATMGSDSHPINGSIELTDFSLYNQSTPLFNKEKISLNLQGQGNRDFSELSLNKISLDSAPLSLDSRGVISMSEIGSHLELQGEIQPDLQLFEPLASNFLGEKTIIRGQKLYPFRVYLPLGQMEASTRYQKSQLAVNLSADRFNHRGINLVSLDIPTNMENAILKTSIEAEMNNGRLYMEPQINFLQTPAILTNGAEEKKVFTDVVLDEPLTKGILQYIHPLFGTLAVPSGKIDMSLNEFSWPLDKSASQKGYFNSIFDISKVSLRYSPFFHSILNSLGLPEENPMLNESLIKCKGAETRVTCSPLTITLDRIEMILGGSIGYDQSLDYYLKIPVTENIAGKLAEKYMESATLQVKIKGTLSKPEFEIESLDTATEEILEKAGRNFIEEQLQEAAPDLLDKFFAPQSL